MVHGQAEHYRTALASAGRYFWALAWQVSILREPWGRDKADAWCRGAITTRTWEGRDGDISLKVKMAKNCTAWPLPLKRSVAISPTDHLRCNL